MAEIKHLPNRNLPAEIDGDHARLPATYENARAALAKCETIDECKDWSDKSAALAAYAAMKEDKALLDMARRIRAHATRRCGEVLKEMRDGRGGDRKSAKIKSVGGHTFDRPTKKQAAKTAGLSKNQQVQATRLAAIPKDEFEKAVDSDNPPTISELAKQGTKSKDAVPVPKPEEGAREGFREATQVMGIFNDLALEKLLAVDPALAAKGIEPHELSSTKKNVVRVIGWSEQFLAELEERKT